MRDPASDTAPRVLSGESPAASLVRLGEASGYKVADGDPDIRGWDVKTADWRKVGSVDDLIVDTVSMQARYMEVKADKNLLGVGAEDRYFLVPIGAARLDESGNDVLVDRVPVGGFTAAWTYERGAFTREREAALLTAYGYDAADGVRGAASTGDNLYDDRRFWGQRRSGREQEPYITRAAE